MSEPYRLLLQLAMEQNLQAIEDLIGPGYKLTLVCRYTANDGRDKDIVLTLDDWDDVISVINKMRGRQSLTEEISKAE